MVILLLWNQQLHADPDGVGSQAVQRTDVRTPIAISQFSHCNLPEVIAGNDGIDLAGGERIGICAVQNIRHTILRFRALDLQPAIAELNDFHKGVLFVDGDDLCAGIRLLTDIP